MRPLQSIEMDFATLYAEDVEAWAEVQVEALRRLATMRGPWANAIDLDNVIEEIESLGSEQRRAVEGLLVEVFAHVLKIAADPESLSAEHWKTEVRNFWAQAQEMARPAMRSRVDMEKIWRRGCKRASDSMEAFDRTPANVPQSCPYAFDDVLDRDFDPLHSLPVLMTRGTGQP
jgi:Domain of unknown function DUF29